MLKIGLIPSKGFAALGAIEQLGEEHFREAFTKASFRGRDAAAVEVRRIYTTRGPGWPPLHPFTVEQKGSSQPLIDTGQLLGGIEAFVVLQNKKATISVGFDDPKLARVANVHEYGAVIPVTDAMRGFLASRGLLLRAEARFIFVPARPVFAEALEKMLPEMLSIFEEELEKAFAPQELERRGSDSPLGRLAAKLRRLFR